MGPQTMGDDNFQSWPRTQPLAFRPASQLVPMKVRMMGGAKAHYDGIVAFSQTDFTEDLKKINVPVLVMHGDDDQIVPYADSGPLSAKLLKNGTLKTYKGFPHGMPTTEAETINADLLAFIKG
jgi:non-heme chloroperoxidase